jgi:hypothetical protein
MVWGLSPGVIAVFSGEVRRVKRVAGQGLAGAVPRTPRSR